MNIAVIFAGGVGKRMNSGDIPKQFLEVDGKPILIYTLEKFEHNKNIDAIVIPCVDTHIDYCSSLISKFSISKVKSIIPGGASAQQSTLFGLRAAAEISCKDDDIVLIHDGVRPLIKSKTIDDNIDNVRKYGNAITCVNLKETILVGYGDNKDPLTIKRNEGLIARAPQSFYLKEILSLSERAVKEEKCVIDSCTMLELYKIPIYTVIGPDENVKITTRDDFVMFKGMIEEKSKIG